MRKHRGWGLWGLWVLSSVHAEGIGLPDPEIAEQALASAEASVSQRLDPKSRAGLEASQSAWEVYRSAECEFRTQWTEGGSVRTQLIQLCRARLAEERVEALRYFLECEEGDLTCPPPP